jgi:hypothetical protein
LGGWAQSAAGHRADDELEKGGSRDRGGLVGTFRPGVKILVTVSLEAIRVRHREETHRAKLALFVQQAQNVTGQKARVEELRLGETASVGVQEARTEPGPVDRKVREAAKEGSARGKEISEEELKESLEEDLLGLVGRMKSYANEYKSQLERDNRV